MGDDGKLYVPESLIPIYRDEIIPLADIAKPNQYEAELLTGIQLKTPNDAWNALQWFHNKGVKTVVLSSTNLGSANTLLAFLSHKNGNHQEKYQLEVPILGNGMRFVGTGDLFTALFFAHSYLTNDYGKALEKTGASLQSVIKNTIASLPEEIKLNGRDIEPVERELKIVQSKVHIEKPEIEYFCQKM